MIASVTKNLVLIGLIGLTLALVASAEGNCQEDALFLQQEVCEAQIANLKALVKEQCCELCRK